MAAIRNEERVGEAWRHHREGRHAEAINDFNDILKATPDNVDAYYGLGLAQRSNGDKAAATASFRKSYDLAKSALKAVRTTSSVDGHHGANDLETTEDDRFLMLMTMIKQRLAELGAPHEE